MNKYRVIVVEVWGHPNRYAVAMGYGEERKRVSRPFIAWAAANRLAARMNVDWGRYQAAMQEKHTRHQCAPGA